MITTKYKIFFNRIFEIPAKILIRSGLNPNQVTLLGLVFGLLSCYFLIATKNVIGFCALIFLTGLFDALDGVVARLSGRVSKFGSYLDAMCDRIFDGMVMFSVALVTGYWTLLFILLLGSFLVSYAKARAAIEVSVSNTEWPDLMERTERSAVFILGLLFSEVTDLQILNRSLFYWTLIGLNFAVYFTVLQRIFRAKTFIQKRAN